MKTDWTERVLILKPRNQRWTLTWESGDPTETSLDQQQTGLIFICGTGVSCDTVATRHNNAAWFPMKKFPVDSGQKPRESERRWKPGDLSPWSEVRDVDSTNISFISAPLTSGWWRQWLGGGTSTGFYHLKKQTPVSIQAAEAFKLETLNLMKMLKVKKLLHQWVRAISESRTVSDQDSELSLVSEMKLRTVTSSLAQVISAWAPTLEAAERRHRSECWHIIFGSPVISGGATGFRIKVFSLTSASLTSDLRPELIQSISLKKQKTEKTENWTRIS